MKYEYEARDIEISGYAVEGELNDMAEKGYRFIGFLLKSTYKRENSYDGIRKFAIAIFEKQIDES